MRTAINPETGERVYFAPSGEWLKLRTAVNEKTGERVYQDQDGAWQPMPAEAKPAKTKDITARDFSTQAAQGAMVGFADEARGLMGAALDKWHPAGAVGSPNLAGGQSFGDLYRQHRDVTRGEMAEFGAAHPEAAMTAELLGAGGTGLLGGLRAGASAIGRRLGAKMAAMPLGQRMAATSALSAGSGGLASGLLGAGEAPEMADVPRHAAIAGGTGALVGAGLGPAAELATTGVQRLAGAARRALAPPAAARSNAAVRKAVETAGLDEQTAAARLRALGPGAIIADLGEAPRALLDSMASQSGRTRDAAMRQLARRSRAQAGEIVDALGEGRADEAIDAIKLFRKTHASPLYERAYARGVEHNDELQAIFDAINQAEPGFWRKAKRAGVLELAGEGVDIDPATLGDAVPSLRGWQAIKKYLDGAEGRALGANDRTAARRYGNVRRRLLRELDEQNSDYRKAREIYAGSAAFEEAIEAGYKFVNDSSAASTGVIKRLSDVDREGYRIGATQAIFGKLEAAGFTADATKIFRTPRMETKLKALLDPEEYVDFTNRIEASRIKQQAMRVGQNSKTSLMQQMERESGLVAGLQDAAVDVASGQGPGGVAAGALARGIRRLPLVGTPEPARDLIGMALLEKNPLRQRGLLEQAFAPRPPLVTRGAGLAPAIGAVPIGLLAGGMTTRE